MDLMSGYDHVLWLIKDAIYFLQVSPGEGLSTEAFLWHLEKAVNRKT